VRLNRKKVSFFQGAGLFSGLGLFLRAWKKVGKNSKRVWKKVGEKSKKVWNFVGVFS